MLIETPYKPGDTVSIKLTSGEEIIGKLVEENNSGFNLKKPLTFMMGPQGLGLVPFMFSASPNTNILIRNDYVIAIVKTADDIAQQYIKQTTGLEIVKGSL